MSDHAYCFDDTVNLQFAEKFTKSSRFASLFKEGMMLIEETAAYLDDEGRVAARSLSRVASLAYAAESMRLTTRLMQIASWLLLHRAVCEGEITYNQVRAEKNRSKLSDIFCLPRENPAYHQLPEILRDLIARSLSFYTRIKTIDDMLYTKPMIVTQRENAVLEQFNLLRSVFDHPDTHN